MSRLHYNLDCYNELGNGDIQDILVLNTSFMKEYVQMHV